MLLELVVSELLFTYYPDLTEGEFSDGGWLICETALTEYAQYCNWANSFAWVRERNYPGRSAPPCWQML